MSDEKKELTYEELMEKLRDPALLQAAATRMGMKVEAVAAPAKKERKLPKIEIPENASPEDIIKAMNEGFASMAKFMQEDTEEKTSSVRQEASQREQAKLVKEIKEFAKSKKDFDELVPMIEPFFNTGKYTIQEAYELGRKASGKAPEKVASKPQEEETPINLSLSKTSEEDGVRSTLSAKPKSVRESAKKNLEDIIRKTDGLEDILADKDNIE